MSAAPVRITKADGSTHTASAWDFKHRPQEEPETPADETTTPDSAVTRTLLEEMIMKTLYRVMRDSEKFSERTSAATAAIKFMAVKDRVGPAFGEDLDAE